MSCQIRRFAAVSTELIVSIGLAVVVLFVALGLFSDNVQAVIQNSKIADIFNGNASKTLYSSFNRDYSDSEVETQMTGEQGLQMLRKIANNKALEQIADEFNGVDTSSKNANSIGYLALAINAIVGQPHVCVYMKKNSDKPCDEDDIGGQKYNITAPSSSVVITDIDTNKQIKISIASALLGGIANDTSLSADVAGSSGQPSDGQYASIRALTKAAKDIVYSKVLLMSLYDTYVSVDLSQNAVKKVILNATNQLSSNVNDAHEECTIYGFFTHHDYNSPNWTKKGCNSFTGDGLDVYFVGRAEAEDVSEWVNNLNKKIQNSNALSIELLNFIFSDSNISSVLETASDDRYHKPSSCEQFVGVINKYSKLLEYGKELSCGSKDG